MGTKCAYSDEKFYFHHTIDEVPNKQSFSMHAHERNEILYVISGEGSFLVEGTEYPVTPGSVFITREGETHKMNINPKKPYERFSLHFDMNVFASIDPDNMLLKAFYQRKLGQNNSVKFSHPDVISSAITKLDMNSDKDRINIVIHAFLLSALLDISENHQIANISENDINLGKNFEIIDYVNTNISENLSLEYLSSKFYVSKSQLNRTFKKITGSTLWDYVIIKRLLLAKSYMKNGMQISESYKKCGFNDYSSFYRAYKKRFGEPPKRSRQ